MARPRLPIAPHLSPEEIASRYRACRTGVEKTHGQILWLLTRTGVLPTPAEVAAQVGLTPAWVRAVIRRWNAEGPDGLTDRRSARNGGRPKLTAGQQAELSAALQQPPPDGGLWTGPMAERTDHACQRLRLGGWPRSGHLPCRYLEGSVRWCSNR